MGLAGNVSCVEQYVWGSYHNDVWLLDTGVALKHNPAHGIASGDSGSWWRAVTPSLPGGSDVPSRRSLHAGAGFVLTAAGVRGAVFVGGLIASDGTWTGEATQWCRLFDVPVRAVRVRATVLAWSCARSRPVDIREYCVLLCCVL